MSRKKKRASQSNTNIAPPWIYPNVQYVILDQINLASNHIAAVREMAMLAENQLDVLRDALMNLPVEVRSKPWVEFIKSRPPVKRWPFE